MREIGTVPSLVGIDGRRKQMSDNARDVVGYVVLGVSIAVIVAVVMAAIVIVNIDANSNRKEFQKSCLASGGTVIKEELRKNELTINCKPAQ